MFKIGDRVRCIDDKIGGPLKKGYEYTVVKVGDGWCRVDISDIHYKAERFESMKSFFRVGDRVVDFIFGDGVISSIEEYNHYPVNVIFDDMTHSYTVDGKLRINDVRRRLYHAGTTFEINEPTPKRDVETTLTLCVSDEKITMCTEEQDVKCFKSLFKDAKCFEFKGIVPEAMVERLNDLYSR